MNGSYFQNPTFPNDMEISNQIPVSTTNTQHNNTTKHYSNNILELNKGKKIKAYVSFPYSAEYKDKVFSGIIEEANQDYLIVSDPSNGNWYLIKMSYLDYLEFEEPIIYNYSENNQK